MKTTKHSEEQQLRIAERELRKAFARINNVRNLMVSKIDYEQPSSVLEKRLDFKEADSLMNSIDSIGSAICFLHDVED